MDKHRPKRPTTLDLFPQLPPAGTQDTINNNSLGKKETWKESHSSSPHVTGDHTPRGAKPKAEDKVRPGTRRPAPKPPTANESKNKSNGSAPPATAADPRTRPRDKNTTQSSNSSPRSQRRSGAGGAGGVAGRGRGGAMMKDRSVGVVRGKEGVAAAAKEEKKTTGRLCSESRGKEKERNVHQRSREVGVAKNRGAEARGRGVAKGGSGAGANRGPNKGVNKAATSKTKNPPFQQEVYLPAMVVPRTPVNSRKHGKNQEKNQAKNQVKNHEQVPVGQSHDRSQENPPALSRSSSEGGSNRMSLSSDTEGPPPGPLNPTVSHRPNPDICEEEDDVEPGRSAPTCCPTESGPAQMDCTTSEADSGGGRRSDSAVPVTQIQADPGQFSDPAVSVEGGAVATVTVAQGGATSEAGLNYDAVKYTLVVDEDAELELVSLKRCLHNDDSDGETVYQSANEDEDPEYQEERMRVEEKNINTEKIVEEEQPRKWKEEEVRRRREEEVRRRRDVVARVRPGRQTRVRSAAEDDSGRGGAPRSKKFHNLFSNSSNYYSATGAGSFGVFSCVLDGVERQQSHRAAYRFVPRHADELQLEMDDPVLLLSRAEDLWCHGYNMRTGATGIFPAFYALELANDSRPAPTNSWAEQFLVRFLGSVQVPSHKGRDVLCSAMQKVACNRRLQSQPPSVCLLDVSVRGVKINVQDDCRSENRGEQCFHFFQLKNISFCGCHPKHSRYFGFITKHPDQQRFACHVMMSDTTLHPLAKSLGRAFQQYFKEHIGYSCPTEDIFIE